MPAVRGAAPILAAVLLGGCGAVPSDRRGGSAAADASSEKSPPVYHQRIVRVDPRLRRQMAVFRAPPRAADRMPRTLRRNVLDSARKGENPDLARRVLRNVRGFVVPTAEGACLYFGYGSGGCVATDLVLAGRLMVTQDCATSPDGRPAFRILGIAPDGFSSVRFVDRGRTVARTAVRHNGFTSMIAKSQKLRLPMNAILTGSAPRMTAPVPADEEMLSRPC